jgi:Fur family transcriptional regulator, iron response regulator
MGRYETMLRQAGLVPTRQRLALAELLFRKGNRHFTAEDLLDDVRAARLPVSRATLYNNLRSFTEHGLLRAVPVETGQTFFDTDVTHGCHLFFEDTGSLVDVPPDWAGFDNLLQRLGGIDARRVNVVIHVRTFAHRGDRTRLPQGRAVRG